MPAQSATTVTIDHQSTGAPNGANDLHLEFDQDVDVKAVNGVAPDDPKADFTIENDGQGKIDLSDMTFPNPGKTTLRVKDAKNKKPKLKPGKSHWTINGEPVG